MKVESKSGPKQHLLLFEVLTEVKDESAGTVTETWLPAFKIWAEVVTSKTDQFFEFQRTFQNWPQYVASTITTFKMAYKSGIDSMRHRIRFGGVPYRIYPPAVDNRRAEMVIRATLFNIHDN